MLAAALESIWWLFAVRHVVRGAAKHGCSCHQPPGHVSVVTPPELAARWLFLLMLEASWCVLCCCCVLVGWLFFFFSFPNSLEFKLFS